MLSQHKSHLQSTIAAALQQLEEVRVAALGQSPTGSRLTSLPEPERAALLERLDHMAAVLRQVLAVVAPDRAHPSARRGVGETRMWVRLLLGNLRETLEDLEPERISTRYGRLDAETAALLAPAVRELLAEVERAEP